MNDRPPDRATRSSRSAAAVPRFLVGGADWAWRFLVVVAALAVAAWVVAQVLIVVVPVFVALLFAAFLVPLTDLFDRWMPRLAATWVALLSVVGSLVGLGIVLGGPIMDSVDDLVAQWDTALTEIENWLQTGPLGLTGEQVADLRTQAENAVEQFASGLIDRPGAAARRVAEIAAAAILTVVVTFFFTKDGPSMWAWMLGRVRPVRRDAVDGAGRAAFASLQGWLRGTAITGVVDGTIIGAALAILGVPAALPLAVITAFAAFLPIIGATTAGVLATAVALASEGPATAVIVAVIVLAVQQIEGDILLPLVMYRQVRLHPVVILLALAVGGAVGGIVGALVAVPLTAAASAAISSLRSSTGDEPPDARPDVQRTVPK